MHKLGFLRLLVTSAMIVQFFVFVNPVSATQLRPDCNPNLENQDPVNLVGVYNDGYVRDGLNYNFCFDIQKVKFAVSKVTLEGKPVLIEATISGVAYFDNAANCTKGGGDAAEISCRITTTGVGLVSELSAPTTKSMRANNSSECADARYNYIPENSNSFIKIGNPKVANLNISTSHTGPFELSFPLLIPTNCASGNYRLTYSWQGWRSMRQHALIGVSGNKINVISKSAGAKSTGLTSNVKAGQKCSKPGQMTTSNNVKLACIVSGKTPTWVVMSPSGSPNEPTLSAADKLVASGCKAFPSAIIRLQNASGSNYNAAFIAAQEAAFYLNDAARADAKYQPLYNAQKIIIQYAQAVGWGGQGYFGDINTVKTAIALMNSQCGSSLSIR